MRRLRHPKRWSAGIAAALAFAVAVAAFAPGLMSFDSFQQLEQARTGDFTSFHPPIMAFVWRVLETVAEGPLAMLLLHGACFFGGLALLMSLLLRSWPAAAAGVLCVALLPPVLANIGTIWKDVGMAAALTAAAGLIALAGCGRRRWLVAAIPFLLYGTAVRHNAAAAVLPLALWWGLICVGGTGRRRRLAGAAVGLSLMVCLGLFAVAVDRALLRGNESHTLQTLLVYDLAGISVRSGDDRMPDVVMPERDFDWRPRYSPKWGAHPLYEWRCDYVVRAPDDAARLRTIDRDEQLAELAGRWLDAVVAHPGAYLAHRLEITSWQFGAHIGPVAYPFHDGVLDNRIGITFEPGAVTAAVRTVRDAVRDSVLFRGWFFVVLATAALLVCRWRRPPGSAAVQAIAASGLLYALPLPFVTVASDFRLLLWTVIAAAIATVGCLARGSAEPDAAAAATENTSALDARSPTPAG